MKGTISMNMGTSINDGNKKERTTMKRMRKWEEHKKNNKSPLTEEVRNSQLKVKEERKRKKKVKRKRE